MSLFQVKDWDAVYVSRYVDWAGHLARYAKYDKDKLVYKVARTMDRDYFEGIESKNHGRQLSSRRKPPFLPVPIGKSRPLSRPPKQ